MQDYLTPSNSNTCSSVAGPDSAFQLLLKYSPGSDPHLMQEQKPCSQCFTNPRDQSFTLLWCTVCFVRGWVMKHKAFAGHACIHTPGLYQNPMLSRSFPDVSGMLQVFNLHSVQKPILSFLQFTVRHKYPQGAQKSSTITLPSDLKHPHQGLISICRHFGKRKDHSQETPLFWIPKQIFGLHTAEHTYHLTS